jgi:hypothetical protein
MANPHGKAGIFSNTESASARPALTTAVDGPDGHCVNTHTRDREIGSGSTQPHISANGTPQSSTLLHDVEQLSGGARCPQSQSYFESVHASLGKLPKMNFSVFGGEDPQLWRSRCENYFNMYGVKQSLWVRVASMHVEGVAAR